MYIIYLILTTLLQILSLLVVADALLSFVLPPTHAIREAIGRILQPIYAPIRRVIPPMGMFDFTPIVVLILIQVAVWILNLLL